VTDRIRLIFTYSIAGLVILGGLFIIYQSRLDPATSDVQGLRLLLAGFVGSALTFVFGRESASASAFQSERAYASGLAAPTIPSVPIPGATSTTTTTEATVTTDKPEDVTDG
jgi:peptidoglycan/LPS O-acetylase OafA/YrhL